MKKSSLNMILFVCIVFSSSFVGATTLAPHVDYASLPRQSFDFPDLGVRFSLSREYRGNKKDQDHLSYSTSYASGNTLFRCGFDNQKEATPEAISLCQYRNEIVNIISLEEGQNVRKFLRSFITNKKMCRLSTHVINGTEDRNGFDISHQKGYVLYYFVPTAFARKTYKEMDIHQKFCPYKYTLILYNPKYRKFAMIYLISAHSYELPGLYETFTIYK